MSTDKKSGSENKQPPKTAAEKIRSSKWTYILAGTTVLGAGALIEGYYSPYQKYTFTSIAEGKIGSKQETSGPEKAAPAHGPYDERLGYTETLTLRKNLSRDFELQGETTWLSQKILGIPLYPVFNRKSQAGLCITDDAGQELYCPRFPRDSYQTYDEIPDIVAHSLLYVENRSLLKDQPDSWNHAIEWPRFARAVLGRVGVVSDGAGGSTLATQIEKFQHSPNGITGSPVEKFSQMLTASVRRYKDGKTATESGRDTVREYLNFMPLSSYPGHGEVIGFPEGMALWFGTDVKTAGELLKKPDDTLTDEEMKEKARIYRQSLSLIMAVKKPSAYLLHQRQELENRIDAFLPALARDGIISERLMKATMEQRVSYADPMNRPRSEAAREKTAEALQIDLLKATGARGLYELRRYDIEATTTIDAKASPASTTLLKSLNSPDVAKQQGLIGEYLLNPGAVGDTVYAFTLYERIPAGTTLPDGTVTKTDQNVIRVQTDSYDGQLNLNEGMKLELGSTAKLRTLISYLQAFSDLHASFKNKTPEELRAINMHPDDSITRWTIDYFLNPDTDKSLNALLEASLERKYHGSPNERFFTGGGIHTFENFEKEENFVNYNVKDAFHLSVNLSFVRMMRDIVYYTETNKMGIQGDIFTNKNSPQRLQYLEKFADKEGQTFLWRAFAEQRGKTAEEVASLLAEKTRRTPASLMIVYRSMFPNAPYEDAEKFVRAECSNCDKTADFKKIYDSYARDKYNLNDRSYLVNVHPLALWLAEYRVQNPDATWKDIVAASLQTRIDTYAWLIDSSKTEAQNTRIRIMLEEEAFTHIHKTWKDLGYSFEKMVPSYASSLGSSGDTPAALAELAGIIQNDGVRRPAIKFRDVTFGKDTPYELDMQAKKQVGIQVLPPELTRIVRREMQGVVQDGTGWRMKQGVKLSDGRTLAVGGKTGTGDNRSHTISKGGAKTGSEVKSRTGTFVYVIDDRFYGCVTVYVDGEAAAKYKFTSGLAVQALKINLPSIMPVIERAYKVSPPASPAVAVPAAPKPPSS